MGITKLKNSVIKSIQRGTVSLDAINGVTVDITAVDISKSALLVSGTGIISVSSSVAAARSFQIAFLNDSQIRITSQVGVGTTVTGTAAWQVIEYH